MKILILFILLSLSCNASAEQFKKPIYTPEEVVGIIKEQYKIKPGYKLYKFLFNYFDQIYDVEFTPFEKGQLPTCIDCGQMFVVPNEVNPIVKHPLHG